MGGGRDHALVDVDAIAVVPSYTEYVELTGWVRTTLWPIFWMKVHEESFREGSRLKICPKMHHRTVPSITTLAGG